MTTSRSLEHTINWEDFFVSDKDNLKKTNYVQDHIHIATKLRTRFSKPSIFFPMGNHIVSPSHLKSLITEVGKEEHLLSLSDLDATDKMNYRAMEKIWKPEILTLLAEKIPDSKATIIYLKAARLAVFAFTDEQLTPIQRISDIWYNSIFIFRFWMNWLEKSGFSTENCLSANTYACVELE